MFLPNNKSIDIIKRWFRTRSHLDETSTKTKIYLIETKPRKQMGAYLLKARNMRGVDF